MELNSSDDPKIEKKNNNKIKEAPEQFGKTAVQQSRSHKWKWNNQARSVSAPGGSVAATAGKEKQSDGGASLTGRSRQQSPVRLEAHKKEPNTT